jgi:7,8-dihydro-6-hydroxymethylpterin-pyrophosphokinase
MMIVKRLNRISEKQNDFINIMVHTKQKLKASELFYKKHDGCKHY